MYHDDDAWMEFRSQMLNDAIQREESIIKKWLDDIGYTDPIGYYRNSFDHEMEIYATRIGSLIGKAGIYVEELRKMLSEEFRGEWNVKFIEIRGGFVNV